ncbi:DUF167 domain-containing protein [Sediminibacterium sp. TEGAF015]|uniref:DUF167 domain-containing protein n=1 Tax=Sediminibacterium sp. TEGAF015 TaxID=575378 RepID=UPI0021FE2FB2|nr:DUF167 family protein [Sediminibacterium sp. TEGAF015]BDQ11098.1 hypothetical protein TEGAF0_03150 [Sediminibacterium sp. TEGAF015]
MSESFYTWQGEDLMLNLLVTAGAKMNQIGKVKGNQLKVAIATQPEKGKATAFLIGYLAELFKVPKQSVELVSGEYIPNKKIKIHQPKHIPSFIQKTC